MCCFWELFHLTACHCCVKWTMGRLGKFQQRDSNALRREEGTGTMLDWGKCSRRAKRFAVAAQIGVLVFFQTASPHASCHIISLLWWKCARRNLAICQMLVGGDRKSKKKHNCALLDAKKIYKNKQIHRKRACVYEEGKTGRHGWRAGWKVRGEGGRLRASPDRSGADLRQQVWEDRRSQTNGGSVHSWAAGDGGEELSCERAGAADRWAWTEGTEPFKDGWAEHQGWKIRDRGSIQIRACFLTHCES